jgi:carboxyl-terminal processing protease
VKRHALLLAAGILGATTLIGGALGSRLAAESDDAPPTNGMTTYVGLLDTISTWSAEPIAPDKLVYASIQGMLSRLDPHTTFLEPDEFAAMQEKQRGSFYGLGIQIQKRNGRLTVISPIEGTPAWKLGIRTGDIITKIEGVPTDDMTTDEAARRLKGPKGTKVHITIRRPGLAESIEMTVTRAEIPTNSIRFAFMINHDTGYVRLSDFTRTSDREMVAAIERLENDGMKRLLLDLRDNPGGVLEQAVDIADIFLQPGEKVVYTRGRTPSSDQDYYSPGRGPHFSGPMVVLVNRFSASASEIVSGALQDHDRALIVGTTTWGKGLVQSVYTLPYGAGLALTTAKYFTPSGRWIQRDYSNFFEYLNPDEDGGTEAVNHGKMFTTDAGRAVYATGGITPDVVIRYDKLSAFEMRVRAQGAFFGFAVQYLAKHPDVSRDFTVTPEVRDSFFSYLGAQNIVDAKTAKADYDADPDRASMDAAIQSEIMSARFGVVDGWRVAMAADKQVQKALGSFDEAARVAALPKKKPIEKKASTD